MSNEKENRLTEDEKVALTHSVTAPDPMSEPCHRFFTEHRKLDEFFNFVISPYLREAQRIRELVAQAPDGEDKAQYGKDLEHANEIEGALLGYLPLLYEMLLCRAVDSYMKYLVDLLALIFRTRPETLRSGTQERVDFILQYSTMEDLVAALSEKRVQQLSYLGMREFSNQLSRDLGFASFQSSAETDAVVRIVETRNLIVHNRSVVNRLFLQRVPNFPAKVGDPIRLTIAPVFQDFYFLAGSVTRVEELAGKKFGVPQPVRRQVTRES